MTNCMCYCYDTQDERNAITSELESLAQGFRDLGQGIIYSLVYCGEDEPRPNKLIWDYKKAN